MQSPVIIIMGHLHAPLKLFFSCIDSFLAQLSIKVAFFLVSIPFLPNFPLKFHFFNDISHLLYIYLLFCNNNYKYGIDSVRAENIIIVTYSIQCESERCLTFLSVS